MPTLRLAHFYLGVFFAPLIVFFAFTGILQVFKLHEAYRQVPGSQGDWIAWFGNFHKEQAWVPPRAAPASKPAPASTPAPASLPREGGGPGKAPPAEKSLVAQPMKWLVAAMGAALVITTCLGVYIAFNYPSRRRGFTIALAAGIVVPLAFMAF
jgi:hypothetical protein